MEINVTVSVPDGDTCDGCDFWYRDTNKRCYCILFGFVELKQKYKANMVRGTDIIKCLACKKKSPADAGDVEEGHIRYINSNHIIPRQRG